MQQVSPTLVNYNSLNSVSESISSLGLDYLSNFNNESKGGEAYQLYVKDFYLTNSISRASSTMAKCSQVSTIPFVFNFFDRHLPTENN